MGLPPQLTRAVDFSAAPAAVSNALDALVERTPELADRLEADDAFRNAVLAVLGASRTLAQLCLVDRDALEVLADLGGRRPAPAGDPSELARWYRQEYLRVAARDLTAVDDLTAVGRTLADLADSVLEAACAIAGSPAIEIAVIGMGKLGGQELNYASDVDLMLVGQGDARRLLEVARSCFRVDVDLRPEGRDGPLVRSLASYEAYWDRWAQTWEFQALLKARTAAGPRELGAAFTDAASARVWGRSFGAEDVREVRRMKSRAEGEIERRGLAEREVKRGRGGIRDIEFAVQLLQLVHGRHDLALRSPTTLTALTDLASAGYVDAGDATRLAEAYQYLRRVEHRLQLVDGSQVHAIPTDVAALGRLARVLGYRDSADATATADFLADLRHHQSEARAIHEELFFRPLLDYVAGLPVVLSGEAAATRLAAFGFADAERTRQALHELTHGLTRSSRMMQQLLPLLLGWLSEAPDPDRGLLGLRTLVSANHRADLVVGACRDSPEAARRLCVLLGTSRLVGAGIERYPELIAELAGEGSWAGDLTAGLGNRIQSALAWRNEGKARVAALRRFKEAETVRIAAADILGLLGDGDVEAVAGRLTSMAEAVLGSVLETVASPVPLAVIAMGRFGGAELSYASDLDVLLVHGATEPDAVAAAETAAEEFLRAVKGPMPPERLYLLDADLRPEGKQGPLARSLGGYAHYYRRWAQTWERQALLRARPVAGDVELGRQFMAIAADFVERPLTETEEREIRRMKARIERERIPARDDPDFHLKLGRGSLADVEWTVQLLELRHGVTIPGTMAGLRALTAGRHIDEADADVLGEAYRFLERTRNRLFLVRGSPGDALPSRPDHLAFLARSLGLTPTELRDTYRRVTRRARQVIERLFYGSDAPRPRQWRPGA